MELILRWDVGVGKVKDIIYKCYRYGVGHASFPGETNETDVPAI